MAGTNIIAALAVFAGLSLALGALDWVMDKLQAEARWRRWYYRTFGRRL